jgi:hypothetical protein
MIYNLTVENKLINAKKYVRNKGHNLETGYPN